MNSSPLQIQFALPENSKPGSTSAKRPAAGPTSRLLRVFLDCRLEGWRHRLSGDLLDAPKSETTGPVPKAAPEDVPGPIVNPDKLLEFSATMSPEELREFFWLCVVDTELRLTDIATHRAAGNLEGMAQVAHGIAREAANLGAARVHILALRLETACRAGKSAGTYGLISALSEAWAQVGDSLCAWLAEQAPPGA